MVISEMTHHASEQNFDKSPSTKNLVPERASWGRSIEFLLACLNYAIGLGNVWRFPYLVYRNKAGSAFLIPYLLMVFVIGLPMFFAELVIGQFTGQGPIKAYSRIAPLFKGLGYCTSVIITFITIQYQMIFSWIIFYLYSSFSSTLKWGACNNEWNTKSCFSSLEDYKCRLNNTNSPLDEIYYHGKCTDIKSICVSVGLTAAQNASCFNATADSSVRVESVITRIVSSEEFFNENLLGLGDATWTNYGWPQWHLVLCLAIAWLISFLCVTKGVQTMAKIVYFTAIFPYVVLTILLVRGVTLDGSFDGILWYITPKFESLTMPAIWGDASSQIFYSFGIGVGSLVTLASYNKFNNNCHFDSLFTALANFLTAVFASFVVFAVLGFLAKRMNVEIDDVMKTGPALSFVTYPEAVLHMPFPQVWAVLFFLMMFVLGIGSQLGGIEAINTSIIDKWPHLRKNQWRVTAGTCIACFIAGLPMCCNGGVYLFTLLEWHTASWQILLIGFAEVVVISWVYGMDRILFNIREMEIKLSPFMRMYWRAIWVVITPIGALGVFFYTLKDVGPSEFRDYKFPLWADALGYFIGFLTLVPMIWSLLKPFLCRDNEMKLSDYLKPTAKWGPQKSSSATSTAAANPAFEDERL